MEVRISFNEDREYPVRIDIEEDSKGGGQDFEIWLTYKEAMHLAGVLIARLFEQSRKSTDSFFKDEFPYWR